MTSPNSKPKAFIIGSPISHSLSPKLHEYWLKGYQIEGSYEAIEVPPEYLYKTIKELVKKSYAGGNVTIPHKEKALMICDEIDQTALAVGAVNTLKFEHGKIKGYNTDVYGFTENLKTGGADLSIIKSALVLGAGGAARAVIIALMKSNIKVTISNRTLEHAQKLAAEFKCRVMPWEEENRHLGEFQLVVNTTSLGMKGQPPLEIDLNNLPAEAVVNDIVYNPIETPFLKTARANGLKTIDGLGMLLYQAVEGFDMWFGDRPEVTRETRQYILSCLR